MKNRRIKNCMFYHMELYTSLEWRMAANLAFGPFLIIKPV